MRSPRHLHDELRFVTEFSHLFDVVQQVALARLRRHEARTTHHIPISELIAHEAFPLLAATPIRHPVLQSAGQGRLLVLMTSDEGLVGPLYGAAVREALSRAEATTQWLLIGRRSERWLRTRAMDVATIPMPSEETAEGAMHACGEAILAHYLSRTLHDVWLIAPRFLSATRQDVLARSLLPLPLGQPVDRADGRRVLLEPSADRVIRQFASSWVTACCREAYWSARRAEYAARAMHVEASRQTLAMRAKSLRHEYFKSAHERVDVSVRETCVAQHYAARRDRQMADVRGVSAT